MTTTKINPSWVKYLDMGGPRWRGKVKYEIPKPWGPWSKILGVVADSEGEPDTTVMYDETGVTWGTFQWTFKSGRLQRLLEFFKSVERVENGEEIGMSLFEAMFEQVDKQQLFRRYGFSIHGGKFMYRGVRALNPRIKKERDLMVDTCMGRGLYSSVKDQKYHARSLCREFAEVGQDPQVWDVQTTYAKHEFRSELDIQRSPLKSAGGTIRSIVPNSMLDSPFAAIFFNLYQNLPGGAFSLFKKVWKDAYKKGLAAYVEGSIPGISGYFPVEEKHESDILDILWKKLNQSSTADWGFKSKQYLKSGGKNPPRIKRIKPAIKKYYGIDLPYIK